MENLNADPVMTVLEVSDYLRVHPSTIYRMLRKKKIPAFRVGSDWRFLKSQLDAFMNQTTVQPVIQG